MIYEVEISAQADVDLRSIYEYIAYELQSPENAIGQLDRLEKKQLLIASFVKIPLELTHYFALAVIKWFSYPPFSHQDWR